MVLDRFVVHALCCASAESTVGHYRVRDSVHELVTLADPSAETEVEGLIPSRAYRRPADLLTSAALPGSLAALDIGVKAPNAVGADEDCVATPRRCNLVLGPSGAALPLTHGLASLNRKVPKSHDTKSWTKLSLNAQTPANSAQSSDWRSFYSTSATLASANR